MKKSIISNIIGIVIFAVLIFVDQITKILADKYLTLGEELPFIGKLITIELVYNRGISYGLGDNASPAIKILVIVITAVIMTALAILYFKLDKRRSLMRLSFVFIVAGGIGNLIDRVYYKVWLTDGAKGVRDMVNVSRFGFAVCNFADFFITAGAIMLVLSFLFFDRDALAPKGKYKLLAEEQTKKNDVEQIENTTEENNG